LRLGNKLAPLIGAHPGEVAIADATSVNLYKLAVAALLTQEGRTRIVTDDMNFPSDLYILEGAARTLNRGHAVDIVRSTDGIHGPAEDLAAALDTSVALVTLSHVTYKSGYRYDIAAMTAAAHRVGALVLWDLSHSVGAVPIDISPADLAVGCTYKYLNGGPGAPAFIYVRNELQDRLTNPISGWWGHTAPFTFDPSYRAASGMRRFLTGTAPMASLTMIEPGLDVMLEAGIDRLAEKSAAQSTYFLDRWRAELAPLGFTLNSPPDSDRRGSHVSLGHPAGLGIDLALINDYGVLPDFRPPDNLRFGIAPLYNRFAEIDAAVDAMVEIVTQDRYAPYMDRRPTVT
jgi:kynureninase